MQFKIKPFPENDLLKIIKLIENKRKILIELGMDKGFQDPQVIKTSQEVDDLIVQYYRLEEELAK